MQVTPEMPQAASEAAPKATGGLITGPTPMPRAGCQGDGYLIPQPADVTPPEKVRNAAKTAPEITFNLNQEYGGLDAAALRKLCVAVSGKPAPAEDEQQAAYE